MMQPFTLLIGGCTMHEAEVIESVLKKHLMMNAARIKFLACFIVALLKVSSVNLTKVALAFPGKAEKASKYKKIQRFFHHFALDLNMVAKLIAALILDQLDTWLLAIDRTNWKFGKTNINVLTLGVAYNGSAIPLIWIPLSKRGNSNTAERISLLSLFLSIFSVDKIKCLTADREFIGEDWFSFLIKKGISFRIRIRQNMLVSNSRGILVPAHTLFRMLKVGEYMILEGRRSVSGLELFVIGVRLPDGEYLILVCDKEPETALDDYKQRWEIETFFGCLKTRGFDFESTHMTEPKRIQKLVALLAITYCWCIYTGEWLNSRKQIKVKKHGRKENSIFRYGLDELREILLNISTRFSDYKKKVQLFFGSLNPSYRLVNDPTSLLCCK